MARHARSQRSRSSRTSTPRRRPGWIYFSLAVALIAVVTVGGFGFGRLVQGLLPDATSVSVPGELASAADKLAMTPDWAFVTYQESWREAREGGTPLGELSSPLPGESADRRFENAFMTHGTYQTTGFFSDIRGGYTPGPPADFERGGPVAAALVRSEGSWRNDGDGWYVSNRLPGHGMDPASARSLPDLLRNLNSVERREQDGHIVFFGLGDPSDYPGVIASDGLLFTATPLVVEVALDDEGRVSSITATTRNLNEFDYNLIITTQTTFDYTTIESLPSPSPLITIETDS